MAHQPLVKGDCLKPHHLGQWIDFGAAQGGVKLQAEQAGAAQRADRLRRERSQFFALGSRCAQGLGDGLDAIEERLSFRQAVLRQCLGHVSSPF